MNQLAQRAQPVNRSKPASANRLRRLTVVRDLLDPLLQVQITLTSAKFPIKTPLKIAPFAQPCPFDSEESLLISCVGISRSEVFTVA